MSRYLSKNAKDHGDFSTSFADLVFGLLFVFFLLAIAMVFNRPEVDAFQKKLDEMQRELDKQTEIIAKARIKLAEGEKEIKRLKKKALEKAKTPKITPAGPQPLKPGVRPARKEKDQNKDALNKLLRDYNKLKKKFKLLEAKCIANNSKLLKKLARLRASNQKLKADLEQLQEQHKFVERHSKELQAILDKVKQMLKQKGLTDILAEVQKMEETLEEKESEREDRTEEEEKELFNDYKLWVTYDPHEDSLFAQLWKGEVLVDEYPSIDPEELLLIAKELSEEYKVISENYTELEKVEHRPRLFLRVHPDSAYGEVQELLKILSKGIQVTIVPW